MRKDIEERKDEILQWIAEGRTKFYMCSQLKCKQDTLNSWFKRFEISYAGNMSGKGNPKPKQYVPFEEYIKRPFNSSNNIRLKLIREGIKEAKCESCGIFDWMGKPAPLELDHIDGDHYNNTLSNLRILCPNCHAQTDTHSGKNIGRMVER